MSDINKIAEKVISQMPSSKGDRFGFVITTLMVISIILTLIRVIQECNKSNLESCSSSEKYSYFRDQISERTIKRSWFTKMMIKKAIRKELSKENYKTYGVELMNSILDVGEKLSNDEVITLVESANV